MFTKTKGTVLQGLTTGFQSQGEGLVQWGFTDNDGMQTSIQISAYLVPSARCYMLSPQSYLQSKVNVNSSSECFIIKAATLEYIKGSQTVTIPYNKENNSPVITMWNKPQPHVTASMCDTRTKHKSHNCPERTDVLALSVVP